MRSFLGFILRWLSVLACIVLALLLIAGVVALGKWVIFVFGLKPQLVGPIMWLMFLAAGIAFVMGPMEINFGRVGRRNRDSGGRIS